MKDRLAKGPVTFELVALRGRDGDPTDDPTLRWDDEDGRETTPLGKISIDALAPSATCDAFSFLPGNLADGGRRPGQRHGVPGPLRRLHRFLHAPQSALTATFRARLRLDTARPRQYLLA